MAAPLNLTQRRESTSPPRAGLPTAGAATQIQTSHLSGWDSNPETAGLPSPPPHSLGPACPSNLEDERSPNDRICLLLELREVPFKGREPGAAQRPPRGSVCSPPSRERAPWAGRKEILTPHNLLGNQVGRRRTKATQNETSQEKASCLTWEERCISVALTPGYSLTSPCLAWYVQPVVWIEVTGINGILSGAEKCEMYCFVYIHI